MSQQQHENSTPETPESSQTPATGASRGNTPPTPPEAPTPPNADAERIAQLERENAELRRENGQRRVKAKTAEEEALATVAKALGFSTDGKKEVSLDEMTKQVSDLTSENQKLRTENRILRRAGAADADPDKLLNWAPFTRDVAALDQSDESKFQENVDSLIKEYVSKNPFLSVAQAAAARSGVEMSGGSGETSVTTPEQFAKLSNAEKNKLYQTNPDLFRQMAG